MKKLSFYSVLKFLFYIFFQFMAGGLLSGKIENTSNEVYWVIILLIILYFCPLNFNIECAVCNTPKLTFKSTRFSLLIKSCNKLVQRWGKSLSAIMVTASLSCSCKAWGTLIIKVTMTDLIASLSWLVIWSTSPSIYGQGI